MRNGGSAASGVVSHSSCVQVSSVEGGLVKLMYCPKENGPTLTIKVRGEHITGTTATGRAVQTIDQPAPMCLSMYSSLCAERRPRRCLACRLSLPCSCSKVFSANTLQVLPHLQAARSSSALLPVAVVSTHVPHPALMGRVDAATASRALHRDQATNPAQPQGLR